MGIGTKPTRVIRSSSQASLPGWNALTEFHTGWLTLHRLGSGVRELMLTWLNFQWGFIGEVFWLYPYMAEKEGKCHKGTNATVGPPFSWPDLILSSPQPLPPDAIMLGIRSSAYGFWRTQKFHPQHQVRYDLSTISYIICVSDKY